jgi:hypothetical protein
MHCQKTIKILVLKKQFVVLDDLNSIFPDTKAKVPHQIK